MIIKKDQVVAQLYTVREYLKTPKDIAASLKKVKKIGYGSVQLSGLGPIDQKELKAMLDEIGIIASSTHEPGNEILDEPGKVADRLNDLGVAYIVYPYPSGIDFSSAGSVKAFAKKLDRAGAVLRKAGITLTYHNHHIEFRKVGGKVILEMIYDLTDPQNLQAEIDTYWVQAGGADPLAWVKRMKGRLPLLHMKDMGISSETKQIFEEIGQGNLSWEPIVKAAKSGGCKWYIVEQDSNHEKGDPFRSLKMSYDYIAANLCRE